MYSWATAWCTARYSVDNTTYATRAGKRAIGPMCASTPLVMRASTAVRKTRRKTTNAHQHVVYVEGRTPPEKKGAGKDSKSPILCDNAAGSAAWSGASREIHVTRCSKAKQNKQETAPRRHIATGDAAPDATPARAPQLALEEDARSRAKAAAPEPRPQGRAARDPSAAAAPYGGGAPAEEPPRPRDPADRPRGGLVRRGRSKTLPGRTRPRTTGPGPTEQRMREWTHHPWTGKRNR